jgi:predicted RNase H-like HicB family nuclease
MRRKIWRFNRVPGESKVARNGKSMKLEVRLTADESGWIVAEVPEFPGCFSQGRTEAEALVNIKEAITAWLCAEEQRRGESMPSS